MVRISSTSKLWICSVSWQRRSQVGLGTYLWRPGIVHQFILLSVLFLCPEGATGWMEPVLPDGWRGWYTLQADAEWQLCKGHGWRQLWWQWRLGWKPKAVPQDAGTSGKLSESHATLAYGDDHTTVRRPNPPYSVDSLFSSFFFSLFSFHLNILPLVFFLLLSTLTIPKGQSEYSMKIELEITNPQKTSLLSLPPYASQTWRRWHCVEMSSTGNKDSLN